MIKTYYKFTIQQGSVTVNRVIASNDAIAFLGRLADAKLSTKKASIFIVDVVRADGKNVRNEVLKKFYEILKHKKAVMQEIKDLPSFNTLEEAMLAVS